MKNLSLILFVFIGLSMQAQKKVEKEVTYHDQSVAVDLDFASDIVMKTWNKETIKIEASVKTEDEKYTEMYELEIKSTGSQIEIGSNAKKLFEAYREEHSSLFNDLDHEFNYILFVPKGVKLELSSITGNVRSEFLQGNFRIDLVTGNVEIEKFKGHLDLNSVTGKINLPVKGSSYSAKTVMGTIHADPNSGIERKSKIIGEEIKKSLEGAANRITLNTVTGDIYLK